MATLLDLITEPYFMEDNIVVVHKKQSRISRAGQRFDSINDIVVRSSLFHTQFLKEFYFMKKVKRGNLVVDLCCGTAAILEKLYRNGYKCRYIGIDYSVAGLRKRSHIVPKTDALLVQADVTKGLPLQDSCVDIMIFSEAVEHFPEAYGVMLLEEIKRVLKPGGLLLITTTYGKGKPLAGHLREYRYQELVDIMEGLGFNIEKGCGLYLDTVEHLDENTLKVYARLSSVYPSAFLRSIFAVDYPDVSRSFLIEASK